MENTRQTILQILRRRKQATVDQLTRELGLAPATVRRHLDILLRDDYVTVSQVRRGTGRPHYVFSLSEAGENLFPKHYVRLTNRIIDEIVRLDAGETGGKTGAELAELVFGKMAERLAETYASQVRGETLEERVRQVAELLVAEGLVFEVEPLEDGGFLLAGQGCPCRRVADAHAELCGHDRRLLAQLLRAEVTFEGGPLATECRYVVRPAPAATARPAVAPEPRSRI